MSEELRRGILKGRVIEEGGELTEEEKKRYDAEAEKVLKEFGILKPDESISEMEHHKF